MRDTVPNSGTPSGRNQSLSRGVQVLEALGAGARELGVRELARELGLNKSIVHRLVLTLADHGFVEQNPVTGKYRIGPRAFEVGSAFVASTGLQEAAMPALRKLAHDHELNATLGLLRDGAVVYIATMQSSGRIVLRSARPGMRAPAHASALGKALLAWAPEETITDFLDRGALKAHTPETITDPAELLENLATIRRCGFALSLEEYNPDIVAVGAAVWDATGQVVAALSGSAPRYILPDDWLPQSARAVTDAAAAISRSLGAPQAVLPPLVLDEALGALEGGQTA